MRTKLFAYLLMLLFCTQLSAQGQGRMKMVGAAQNGAGTKVYDTPSETLLLAPDVKPVTAKLDVLVGGTFPYAVPEVTYHVRQYVVDGVTMLDVEMPTYTIAETLIGDLQISTYTVCGLTYDAQRGGYFRDYSGDGLSAHFVATRNGVKTIDGDYPFNPEKDNNILVKFDGDCVVDIINTFQMGAMPFGVETRFGAPTGESQSVIVTTRPDADDTVDYSLDGLRLEGRNALPVVIRGGKKYLCR